MLQVDALFNPPASRYVSPTFRWDCGTFFGEANCKLLGQHSFFASFCDAEFHDGFCGDLD